MKKALATISLVLIVLTAIAQVELNPPRTRWFDANKQPKNIHATNGVYSIVCFYESEWNYSGDSQNMIFDVKTKKATVKPNLELNAKKAGKIQTLYQNAQAYIKQRGYDEVTLMRMSIFLMQGNDAQKALCQQVLDFTDLVTKEGYFTRRALAEACETLEQLKTVSTDYSGFNEDDPGVTLIQVEQAK